MVDEWRADELMLVVGEGVGLSLDAISAEVLGRSLPNVKVDTGAMRGSGYSIGPNTNSYAGAAAEARSLSNSSRDKVEAAATVGDMEAVAGYSVEYALVQEANNPTLAPAMESVAGDVPGIMKRNIKL